MLPPIGGFSGFFWAWPHMSVGLDLILAPKPENWLNSGWKSGSRLRLSLFNHVALVEDDRRADPHNDLVLTNFYLVFAQLGLLAVDLYFDDASNDCNIDDALLLFDAHLYNRF
jgi:hypothetical protein